MDYFSVLYMRLTMKNRVASLVTGMNANEMFSFEKFHKLVVEFCKAQDSLRYILFGSFSCALILAQGKKNMKEQQQAIYLVLRIYFFSSFPQIVLRV